MCLKKPWQVQTYGFQYCQDSNYVSFVLQKNEEKSDSQLDYARVLISTIYTIKWTRLNIVCAISKLSRSQVTLIKIIGWQWKEL